MLLLNITYIVQLHNASRGLEPCASAAAAAAAAAESDAPAGLISVLRCSVPVQQILLLLAACFAPHTRHAHTRTVHGSRGAVEQTAAPYLYLCLLSDLPPHGNRSRAPLAGMYDVRERGITCLFLFLVSCALTQAPMHMLAGAETRDHTPNGRPAGRLPLRAIRPPSSPSHPPPSPRRHLPRRAGWHALHDLGPPVRPSSSPPPPPHPCPTCQ